MAKDKAPTLAECKARAKELGVYWWVSVRHGLHEFSRGRGKALATVTTAKRPSPKSRRQILAAIEFVAAQAGGK